MTPAISPLSDDRRDLLIVARELFWTILMLFASYEGFRDGKVFWCMFFAFWSGTHAEKLMNNFDYLRRRWNASGLWGKVMG